MDKPPLTVSDAAQEAARRSIPLSSDGIRKAFDRGELDGFRTAGGLRLINASAFAAYLDARAEQRRFKRAKWSRYLAW